AGPAAYCRHSRQWLETRYSSYILQQERPERELPPASFSIYDNGNRKRDANIEHACDETSAGHGHQGPPAADDAVADCTDGAGDGRLFQLAAAARDRTAAAPARVDDR